MKLSEKKAITGLLTIFFVVLLGSGFYFVPEPQAEPFAQGQISRAAVQDDYYTARDRLGRLVATLQSVEGFVPAADIASATRSLNDALDYLEEAGTILQTQPVQAAAAISQANAVMDEIEPMITSLVVQADATRRNNLVLIVVGIGAILFIIICFLFIKRRMDRKSRKAFLDAEIDYSGI